MSIAELLAIFRAHWRLLAGSLAFALACGGAYLAVAPSQYEAEVTIRIGELGRVGPELRGSQIESDPEAEARMRGSEFQALVLNSLGWKDPAQVSLLKSSYEVTVPEKGHLKVELRARSPEDATRAVATTVDALVGIHRDLTERIGVRRARDLEKLESSIAESEAYLSSAEGLARDQTRVDSRFHVVSWMNAIKEEKARLRNLRLERIALKEVTAAESIRPTRAVEAVSASQQPVVPNRRRVWFFSAFVGVLLGVFLVTVVAIRRLKLNAASSSAGQ